MSRNFLNQDFGSDEEDDDFNPQPADDQSDDEDVNARPQRQQQRGQVGSLNDDEDEAAREK